MSESFGEKRKTGLPRLLQFAGGYRNLLVVSGVLSVVAAMFRFTPFVATYFIVAELVVYAADPLSSDMELIRNWGLGAFTGLCVAVVTLYASSMASHVSVFRLLYELRIRLAEHLSRLPMGYHTKSASGALKKVVELSVEKIEGFVAHRIPDLVSAVTFPLIMLGGMFVLPVGLFHSRSAVILFLVLPLVLSVPIIKPIYLAGNMRMLTEGVERIDEAAQDGLYRRLWTIQHEAVGRQVRSV